MIHLHNIILGFTPVLSDPSNSCADATAARAEIHLVKNIHFRSNIILYIIVDSPEPREMTLSTYAHRQVLVLLIEGGSKLSPCFMG